MVMLLVGLTGGIGTGKTAVSNMFVNLGAHLIDADVIARDVVKSGKPGWKKIVDTFGQSILDENKEINRKKLGEIVFNYPEKRKQLEEITHPDIIAEENRLIKELRKKFKSGIIMLDAALLIEAGYHDRVDKLIVVYIDRETQVNRLMGRDNLDRLETEKRIDSQVPLDDKAKLADYVVDNSKPPDKVKIQVSEIYTELIALDERMD